MYVHKRYCVFVGLFMLLLVEFICLISYFSLTYGIGGASSGDASSGTDSISNKLLKEVKEAIVKPLILIQMLMTGVFPNLLKNSKVIPLYKKDDNTNMSNYRLIASIPSISIIFKTSHLATVNQVL